MSESEKLKIYFELENDDGKPLARISSSHSQILEVLARSVSRIQEDVSIRFADGVVVMMSGDVVPEAFDSIKRKIARSVENHEELPDLIAIERAVFGPESVSIELHVDIDEVVKRAFSVI